MRRPRSSKVRAAAHPQPAWRSPHSYLVEEPGAAAGGDDYPEARGPPDVLPVFAVGLDGVEDCLGRGVVYFSVYFSGLSMPLTACSPEAEGTLRAVGVPCRAARTAPPPKRRGGCDFP